MSTIWVTADPHFGHRSLITTHLGCSGRPVRERFASVEEMNEFIIEQYNAVVRPPDHLYILGDFAMHSRDLPLAKRLNGHKRLVGGNHDQGDIKLLGAVGFEKVFGIRVLANVALTHVPVHPSSVTRWLGNAHGHIHDNPAPAGQYLNVCCEMTGYQPLSLEEVVSRLEEKALLTS